MVAVYCHDSVRDRQEAPLRLEAACAEEARRRRGGRHGPRRRPRREDARRGQLDHAPKRLNKQRLQKPSPLARAVLLGGVGRCAVGGRAVRRRGVSPQVPARISN